MQSLSIGRLLPCSLALGALALLCDAAAAHGGEYRGPGDVVPPNTRGTGQPRISGPGGRGAPGPVTGVPAAPGGGSPGVTTPGGNGPFSSGNNPTTPRGSALGVDLARWQFWWEFNKDPYLDLKNAIHAGLPVTGSDGFYLGPGVRREGRDSLQPSDADIRTRILPALRRALESTENRDLTSAVLVALGKIGRDAEGVEILELMRPRLKSPDQEIRETAALAMGISQMRSSVDDLVALFEDSDAGRELTARATVDDRTRSFAGYALGLIAQSTTDVDLKRRVFTALRSVLADTDNVDRNVAVAAVLSLSLVQPGDATDKHRALHSDCVDTLWDYYRRPAGQGEQQIQAHVLPAIAKLIGRGSPDGARFKDACLAELTGSKRRNINIYQSAAITLGQLCEPRELTESDAKYSDALLRYYRDGRDQQTRYFALMALGKIGGNHNRNELLKVLARGTKALVKPWAALALGVLAFDERERGGDNAQPDSEIGRALLVQLRDLKSPEPQGAIAIALGLTGYLEAADNLRDLLARNAHRDELAGYLCIGLALMGDDQAIDPIRVLVQKSVRRPDLLKQAAIALGKLGDKNAADLLLRILNDTTSQTVAKLSAVASALGYIGDQRSVTPLVDTMFDESLTPLSRAFAAAALGGVADKEPLPWNSKIGVATNYRAAVETLVNGASGILEIL